MHGAHRLVFMDAAVSLRRGIVCKIPRVYRKRAHDKAVFGVPAFFRRCHIVYRFLKPRKHALHPLEIACRAVVLPHALNDKVFDIGFKFKTHKRHAVIGEKLAAILIHKRPMHVVKLFYKLEKIPLVRLLFDDKVEIRFQIVFPVPERLHHMNVIAHPVMTARDDPTVDKEQAALVGDGVVKQMQKQPRLRAVARKHTRQHHFVVVVRSVFLSVDVH